MQFLIIGAALLALAVGAISVKYLGPNNEVEQAAEAVGKDLIEEELDIPAQAPAATV